MFNRLAAKMGRLMWARNKKRKPNAAPIYLSVMLVLFKGSGKPGPCNYCTASA